MQDPQAKVGEVAHAAGAPEDRPQAAVEPLRPPVARAAQEVVGDVAHPILQRLVERLQRRQPELPAAPAPVVQPPDPGLRGGHRNILEYPLQLLAVLGQAVLRTGLDLSRAPTPRLPRV